MFATIKEEEEEEEEEGEGRRGLKALTYLELKLARQFLITRKRFRSPRTFRVKDIQ